MPQIDKITYFNQLFWLFLSFSFYYFILLKVFLPKVSSVLKARKKKLTKGSSGSTSFVADKKHFTEVRGSAVENYLSLNSSSIGNNSNFVSELNNRLVKSFSTITTKELHKVTVSTLASHDMILKAR